MNNTFKNIAITGVSGSIGHAFVNKIATIDSVETINVFSRSKQNFHSEKVFDHIIDYKIEDNIREAADFSSTKNTLDLVIVANGILHDNNIFPEKKLVISLKKNLKKFFLLIQFFLLLLLNILSQNYQKIIKVF